MGEYPAREKGLINVCLENNILKIAVPASVCAKMSEGRMMLRVELSKGAVVKMGTFPVADLRSPETSLSCRDVEIERRLCFVDNDFVFSMQMGPGAAMDGFSPSVEVVERGASVCLRITDAKRAFETPDLRGPAGPRGERGPAPSLTADAEGSVYADGQLLTDVLKRASNDAAAQVDAAVEETAARVGAALDTAAARTDAAVQTAAEASVRAEASADNADSAASRAIAAAAAASSASSGLETPFDVLAHSECTLEGRVGALESVLLEVLSGKAPIAELQVAKLGVWGANNLVLTGRGAPAVPPDRAGQLYVDTAARALYYSTDNAAVSDWQPA